jgi:signal transduction histidine kinase
VPELATVGYLGPNGAKKNRVDPRPVEDLLQSLGLCSPECNTVLLVDDEFEVLAVLEALLEDEFEVQTAQGGAEALEILGQSSDIDLVITDQRMPGMTGVELLAIIADRWPDLYRIVLTAYSDVDPIVAAINKGSVDRFVLKPWDPDALREQVAAGLVGRTERVSMRLIGSTLAQQHQAMTRSLSELKDAQGRAGAAEHLAVLEWMSSGLSAELERTIAQMKLALDATEPGEAQTQARVSMGRISSFLDDISRLDRGGSTEQIGPTDPRKLISEAVRQLQEEDLGDNNPVHVQIDADVGTLHLAPNNMRLAILALLRNATRASPPDMPITVRVRREGSTLATIEVADQGVGMTTTVLQHATRPFFTAFDPPGNGLGLAICRLIAESHGGRLSILDNPPTGVLAQLWLRQPEGAGKPS